MESSTAKNSWWQATNHTNLLNSKTIDMNRTMNIIDRLAAITTALIMLMPDMAASAKVLSEQPWNAPAQIEYVSSSMASTVNEAPADTRTDNLVASESEAFEVRLLDQHVAYLNGHSLDALNKPSDDVYEFEIKGGVRENVKVSFESDAQDLGITINGQRFIQAKDGEVVLGKEYLRSGANTLMFSQMGEGPARVNNLELSPSAEMASAEMVLSMAEESDFMVESSDALTFGLLTNQTAAIPSSMSNVTRGATAYRSTGTEEVITIKVGVSKELSESQLREAQVMYFDYNTRSWQQAFVKNVDHANYMIEADAPGGSDYFAAMIKTPEMPEAAAFMPTAISDLEPKTPAEGINLIQPPKANQQGDANVSYPIGIPQGRQGMTPQISLNYSSSGS